MVLGKVGIRTDDDMNMNDDANKDVPNVIATVGFRMHMSVWKPKLKQISGNIVWFYLP